MSQQMPTDCMGSLLHGYREGGRFPLQLHEAEGCGNHRAGQTRDINRLQRHTARDQNAS